MSNTYCKLIASIVAVVSYVCALPNAATAQSQKGPLAVADNDSVFIDSKSFTITPGRAKVMSLPRSRRSEPAILAPVQLFSARVASSTSLPLLSSFLAP